MMSVSRWLVAAAAVATVALSCHGARILAVFPAPSRSHLISFQALTTELAARGHHLTVVSSFPQDTRLANYTDIKVPLNRFDMENINMFDAMQKNGKFAMINMLLRFARIGGQTCEHYLGHPEVQQLISAENDKFDLLIIQVFFNECFLGFAHKFNIPIIGIASMGGMHWMLDTVGNPSPYSYVPHLSNGFSDHMTFLERLQNTLTISLHDWFRTLVLLPSQDAVMRKYFNGSGPLPYITELEGKTSLLLLNNHVSLSYPRPYLPNVVEVGGMHIKPGGKLSKDLQKFLDEAKDGVIYFSMGSNLKSSQLHDEVREAFLDAFSKMKQRILWKWEEESLPGQPDNVRLGKWLPQSAILEHSNTRLFITHGGLLSMQEAVYNGVPIMGIPIFGDQNINMKRVQQLGLGLTLQYNNITSESLQWAMNSVLSQPSYRDSAKMLSIRFRDQPSTPLETAVYWTEYILRHNGAPHLRSAALDLSWYQYYLLDVVAVLVLASGLVALVLYKVTRAVVALCARWTREGGNSTGSKVRNKPSKEKSKLN